MRIQNSQIVYILRSKDASEEEVRRVKETFEGQGYKVKVLISSGNGVAVLTPLGMYRDAELRVVLEQLRYLRPLSL